MVWRKKYITTQNIQAKVHIILIYNAIVYETQFTPQAIHYYSGY